MTAPAKEGDQWVGMAFPLLGTCIAVPCTANHACAPPGLLRADHELRRGDGVKTSRERAEEKRLAKLDLVRQQVENGDLVIRQMTEEERRRYPPRPNDRPQRPRRW